MVRVSCLLAALLCCYAHQGSGQTSLPDRVQSLMEQGSAAMHAGQPAQAVSFFRQAVAAAPDFPGASLGLGLAELRVGDTDDARTTLQHVIALDPRTPGAHLFLGIADYQGGQTEASLAALREEVALQPDNVDALTWLGIVELAAGDPDAAATPLDQASALSPKDSNILYYRGRAHSLIAEEVYKQLYKLDPDSVNVHRALAESDAASGQPAKAIAEYQAAIRKQPGNPDLYESLANEYQQVSEFDAAAAAYQQELKLNPSNPIALYNLGKMRVERGDPAAGVTLLEQAFAAHAAAAPTAFYLGLGLAESHRDAEALPWLQRSLAADPSEFIEESAYFQLTRIYARLGRKQDEQAALTKLEALKAQSAKGISAHP